MSEPGVWESEVDGSTTFSEFCVALDKRLQGSRGNRCKRSISGRQRIRKGRRDRRCNFLAGSGRTAAHVITFPAATSTYKSHTMTQNSRIVVPVNALTSLYWEKTTKGLEGERNLSRPIRTGHGWKRLAITNLHQGDKQMIKQTCPEWNLLPMSHFIIGIV